jgi:mono/diheme cytochrome c family protein
VVSREVKAVTEIPEHLLNRSKARRAEASGDAPSASTPAVAAQTAPATQAKAAPVPAQPKVEKPDPVYVVAAKTRRKIPFWAMSGLALLPLWAFLYLIAIEPADKVVAGPIATGSAAYSSCAGCHGADGAGGAGQVMYAGEVLKSFPRIEDMLNFVYVGSQAYAAADLTTYGDPNREGGARKTLGYNGNPMPQQGKLAGGGLTDYQILGTVCHIRYKLSGADSASETWASEYEKWCSPDSEIFKALQAGTSTFDSVAGDFPMLELGEVGSKPRPSIIK